MNGSGHIEDPLSMKEEFVWYTPIMIRYDTEYDKNWVNDTDATKKEEERIKDKQLVTNSMGCIELKDMNAKTEINGKECSVEVPSDYPHVCLIIVNRVCVIYLFVFLHQHSKGPSKNYSVMNIYLQI